MIHLLAEHPRVGVLEASRRLGVARGTVQARLNKLTESGVITGWGPDLDPEALGYPVTAFLTLEISQATSEHGGHEAVADHLAAIPEVLEAFTITGAGDMWCRVVARSNNDLQRVIDAVLSRHRHRPLLHRDRAGEAGPLPSAAAGALDEASSCGGPRAEVRTATHRWSSSERPTRRWSSSERSERSVETQTRPRPNGASGIGHKLYAAGSMPPHR